ncbi:MAG TPA: radical SAM protein [Candidatus Ozemobacteraceae bacterium]
MNIIKNIISKTLESVRSSSWGSRLLSYPPLHAFKEGLAYRILIDWLDYPVHLGLRDAARRRRWQGPTIISRKPAEGEPALRVLLVQIPLPANLRHKRIIPMNLAYLAGTLCDRFPGIEVGILDAQVHDLGLDGMLRAVSETKWDWVCVGSWTIQYELARTFLGAVKQARPETLTMLGGVHATILPDEAGSAADWLVIGEAEWTLHDMVKATLEGRAMDGIPGTARLVEGTLQKAPPRPLMGDLDELPFPAYELLPLPLYDNPLHVVGGERLPIFGSRGCPYACSFCNSPQIWHRKVRYRRPEKVVEEMTRNITAFGIRHFHFWDDNFTLNRRFVEEFCRLVIEKGLQIKWVALDRAEHLNKNKDLLPLMRQAGCVGIEIGVESANPDTFAFINKRQGFEEVRNAVKNQKDAGLAPLYTCMAFNPGETINGYYFQKLFLDQIQSELEWYPFFHPFSFPLYLGQFATPYPGTEFGRTAPEMGMIVRNVPEDRYHHQINFIPNSLLDDMPVLTGPVTPDDYATFLIALTRGFWSWFPAKMRKGTMGEKLRPAHQILVTILPKWEGRITLRKSIQETSDETGLGLPVVARTAALLAYIFGQQGLIRSALHQVELEIRPNRVRVPGFMLRQMRRIVRSAGLPAFQEFDW